MVSNPMGQAMEGLHSADGMFHGNAGSRMLPVVFYLRGGQFWLWVVFRFLRPFVRQVYFGFRAPGTEAEMEAQHVEGGVGLEVIQNKEKLFPERVEVAFWPARWNLLGFAPLAPFQLDGIVSRREVYGEYVEL